LSADPDNNLFLSIKIKQVIASECPSKTVNFSPVMKFQMIIDPSSDPEAILMFFFVSYLFLLFKRNKIK